ncbi:MAG TPA: MarR family transcriptional regulator [Acidimicrobiales bacterium]
MPSTPSPDDPTVVAVERAMVKIRRSQARRALGPPMLAAIADRLGLQLDYGMTSVVDAVEEPAPDGGDVTVGLVAERLGLDASRASRLVASAVAAGLVRREASQEDGRRSHLTLTDLGQRVLEVEQDVRRRNMADRMADWSAADRRAFAELITRFVDRR